MKLRALFSLLAWTFFSRRTSVLPGRVRIGLANTRNKKFLGGRAVFQLSIEQSGSAMQVSFDAAWADGHGAAPEAEGPAKVSGNTLTFTFKDTFENSGTGTITRAGNDILVSLNPTHVVEPRCLAFYGKNMRLKRVAKK